MYSCRRLICISKIALGLISIPVSANTSFASATLFSCFIFINCCWNLALSANWLSCSSFSRCNGQSLPIFSSIKADNLGLQAFNQRRGVIPLVTLVNLFGHILWNSGNRFFFTNDEWISATPFTLKEPITDKLPIRIIFSLPSSMIDNFSLMTLSPGHTFSTSFIKRWLIS